ncbi:Kinesin-like protein KIF18A [Chionoecetes opilio]|uniref:Kinesin-like protein KIF18A n=1 Tax=Chionoecetes opilio TaxID=41210 RepID=A0A8J5CQ52_CHIOP|nr:Kinesin-like protein KIF18A [Chionoecetes opilio]
MTKNRQALRRLNSPVKSPRRHNTSLRKAALVRRISGEVQFGAASKANLKVVVRVRPQNQQEQDKGARCVVDVLDEHMLVFDPKEDTGDGFFFKGIKQRGRDLAKRQPLEKKFMFESVFGDQSTNTQLYEATAHPLIETLLQGYNCCVFAYGATGAGKTYSMLGRQECPGITSLTLQELYQRLEDLKGHKRCEVAVSYLEVYNETVRDLLGNGKPLALQEMGQQVMVPGLSLHKPNSAEELLQMLAQGNSSRTQHATDANAESSRSHAVFQIFVRQQDLQASAKATVTISKLSMIDLAGSERGVATGFRGARFKEGSSINKSLLALASHPISLKDSLGGNCRSVMIAAISPASTTFEDTYNTLRYANRAKTIRTTIRNNVKNVNQHVSDYIKVVAGLRDEVASLREKVKEYQEKEEAWEAQRSVWSAAAATATPQPAAEAQQTERVKVEEICEEEVEVQRQLKDVSSEQKALQQELLQLEADYKATELKRHRWLARLARVKVVVFASAKLDKTVKKCERTIHALDARLSATANCVEKVRWKLVANRARMQEAQEALICFGAEPGHFSKHSQGLVEKHNTSTRLRGGHHHGEHLQDLLREDFKEHHASEQLTHVLLDAVKDMYLNFRQKEQCCPEVRGIFQRVVDGLDECRIAWADQQGVAGEEGGEAASGEEPRVAKLDVDYFAHLPGLDPVAISPMVLCEPTTTFRKSSLMTSVPASVPQQRLAAADSDTTSAAPPRPCPVSPPPSNAGGAGSLNTTATLTSPVLLFQATHVLSSTHGSSSFPATMAADTRLQPGSQQSALSTSIPGSSPAKVLVTHGVTVPSASNLSIITAMTHGVPVPSASNLSIITAMTHDVPVPSASNLSTITATPTKVLNVTVDIPSPSVLFTANAAAAAVTPVTERQLGMTHSDTKLLPQTACPSQATLSASSQAAAGPGSAVLPSTATSGPAVARKLFSGDRTSLNSTFNIAEDNSEEPSVSTLPAEGAREAPPSSPGAREAPPSSPGAREAPPSSPGAREAPSKSPGAKQATGRSPGAVGLKSGAAAARSPLVPVNRASHSNLLSIPEKHSVKPPLVRGFRGIANRRAMNRTPHKALLQSFTPGKGVAKETGMRRSVSTPSLLSQQSSTRKLSTFSTHTKTKLKGFGGTLQRTTSFLKSKTTNQENAQPRLTRRPSGMLHRPTSPCGHPRSPGLSDKA